ncbi:dynein heavy chain domain-containing protein 1 isoform X1 [Sebastes umbrosus]|uniref:dynein heavy chain domain-containing protein 1 isoform X1 n=1 Tax=Sebastes umbrosus TaxID=72105 RepID=UPI00189F73A1|nr:dynein heavy chain domain-containing protein 1 isoform X1 [Sebastes umbrosus]XP_037619573.1 dynein heavy chain domain-containing protein 1 isoform X1 [Sebastes umbrosus]XP_037619574.1 dynein heavy chain domain-containing protein 1 isoform X1 [Sebastes umbrosus]
MFAATSEKRSHDGASQTCNKDNTGPGSKVRKKTRSPEVTLPPLCSRPFHSSRILFSRTPVLGNIPSDRPLSVVDLSRLIAQVGPGTAIGDTKWTEGPRLMASALGTDLPIGALSLTEKAESIKVTTCEDKKITTLKNWKATKPNEVPLTGTEVVHIFANKGGLVELKLYYLKEVDGDSYRPYDLRVVESSKAGSEHYVFSSDAVLHVTERGYGGVVSLAEWHRESMTWKALQEIPFFRDFRLRKAFTRWHKNGPKNFFQRKCKDLQEMLLIAVPQFRNALFLFTRIIDELKGIHRLPQEESKTFTLLEFKNVLITMNQECVQILKKLSQYRAVILNVVREKSYKAQQELQLHMEYAKKPNKCPTRLLLAHQQELKRELARSESILEKLGNFAALVNQMTVQSLVTVIRRDVISFLDNVVKRKLSQQCCLFHTELCFSADSQLTVDPPIHVFQEAVSEALLTAGDSVIQMCDTCGLFLETSNSVFTSDGTQDLTSDLRSIEHHTITEENKSGDGLTGCRRVCCSRSLRDASAGWQLLPNQSFLMVQGSRVHGCYHPLQKRQLEWHISINDVTTQVEKEQANIMQEAELETQQLCESYSWLVDVHVIVSQWSQTSLESMKGQPALLYEEHIKKVRFWTERIHTVPSSISTSNRLFIIQCTCIKESLGQQLKSIEEEVLEQLVEQIKLHSESLISDMEKATAELDTDPQDLHDISKYALVMRESVKMLADMQKHLEYIHSLQETLCMNYRKMTEQEVALEKKMLDTRDRFIPLLKQAESVVCHHFPSMVNALDTIFSFLACDLKNTVSRATSGPFLDPTQNAKEMASKLIPMCLHVHNLNAKLEQLSRDSQNLHEQTMDLTSLTSDVQKVKARKELWELIAVYTTWMEEWKQLLFSEVVVSQAQGRIAKWREQALSLTSVLPTHDAVLQEALGILESLSHQVVVMAKLQSPTLKQRHWKDIFQGMGLLNVPKKKVTVGELMSQTLEVDQKLITKIFRDAQAECDMEQTFQKLREGWEARLFHLDEFTLPVWHHREPQHGLTETEKPTEGTVSDLQTASQHSCNDARFTMIGLEIHFAEIESDLIALSTMLKSPHSAEFRLQMDDWMKSLQDLGKLLCLFERYQKVWAFLTKMFHETSFSVQRVDLLERFQPVDKTFKEIKNSISSDPHVLNFVHSKKTNDRFHGNSLYQILIDGLSTMEAISNQMGDLLETLCDQFPRLWFLSDREVIQLLSFHPTPFTMQTFVRKCFKGIRWLEVDCVENVLGFFGSLHEHITFLSPLEPNLNALVWLCSFEKQLKLTMVQLMKQCAVVQKQLEPSSQDVSCDKEVGDILFHMAEMRKMVLPELDLLSEYPLQCLLVAEEAVWCRAVLQTNQESSPVKLSNMKACNSAKLKTLGCSIRDGVTGAKSESLVSKYTMMCLRALVQLTMKHAQQLSRLMEVQCVLESSFEWLSLMKYHLNSESLKGDDDPTCYVDVLGHRLQYDYEYFGPEDWEMVHTPSTDRAILGILLALTSYRCGFVSGPCISGKKTTVVQLGKALGRQVVNMQCCPSMRPGVVQRMLLGALQTGAWLLLDSVDLLTQGVLSLLGQHLVDIHQSFSELTKNKNQRVNEDRTADGIKGCKNIDSGCCMVLAGRSISASKSYGCVLVSSKGCTFEVPESLRCATRPIALTHPDYRIIAEVKLASLGFLEATSLSGRLVSLISLAKDSLCLPDFINDDQSCHLVVLEKIISASEMHLQLNLRQRRISDEAEGAAADQADPVPSQNVTARVVEKDRKEIEKASRVRSSHLLIMQGLMEETAIVKAILSVVLPVLYEHKKASQFNIIFKDTFPIACQFPLFQQYIEKEEKIQLKDAVTEELQRKLFHSDTELTSRALTLYQTMKLSQAVILIGPSGSGKTTCYCALAGALNHLSAKEDVFENENTIEGDTPQISATTWTSVDTVVLFLNAMSHEEVFGCFCEKRGWQDGAVGKVLRDSEQREPTSSTICNDNKKSDQIQKWLVMDGSPVGQPGWLDYLTTMCSPDDPFLYLPSGETLPSQSHLKLLMEVTDLRDASPSAVTRCSFVYFTGTDLWKAVWKSEVDALSVEDKLDQGTLKMWNRLADDLFSSTLSLLTQKALTSAVHDEGEALQSTTYGLQEITSFVRILRALLLRFGKDVEIAGAIPQTDTYLKRTGTVGTDPHTKQDLLARNLFLVAYIWGFSGHLHPRHQPQFDSLARQVLFTCRYKIVVPDEESVFEHFLNLDSRTCPKSTLLANPICPKYGSYTFLLNLMLEANQPVLLAGEPGSGKTTLCRSLLSFDKPYISLPASPLLSSRDLRTVLDTISCQKSCKDALGSKKLLLFLDDLHEAPCDVFGKTSTALETLRQSISMGQILTFDAYNLKLLSAATISYMATCCVFGLANRHNNVMSSRLSRLFSIFVLPSLSMGVVLSMHSLQLKTWLNEVPLQQHGEDMARCIITATKNLYHAVRDQFQPTVQTPHFMFSHHDLQKVFRGMCLWQPNIPNTGTTQNLVGPASVLNVAHLWMHECMRTFGDRLCSEDESKALVSLIAKTATTHYGVRLVDETQSVSADDPPAVASICKPIGQSLDALNLPQEPQPAGQSDLEKGHTLTEPSFLSGNTSLKAHPLQPQILQHMEDILAKLVFGPELSEASMNQQHNLKNSCSYQDRDLDVLLQELCALMDRKEEDKGQEVDVTTRLIVHRQRVSQLLHILRVLLIPGGHGVLIGSDRGTGRKTTVRLATCVTGYQLMEVHPGNENKLHEILKEAGNQSRVDGVNIIVLVHEGISPSVREELLVAMAHRTYPGLCADQELRHLLLSRVTAVRNSRRYLMDSWMFEKCLSQSHRNVHVFLLLPVTMTDSSEIPANNGPHGWNAQLTKALSISCCVEVYQPWSNQSLLEVAAQCLKTSPHKIEREGSGASLSVAMAEIHQSACQYASVLLTAQPFSPQTYMEFIAHFGYLCNHLHEKQQSQASRLATVLSHLDVLNSTAVQCKHHLMRLKEKAADTQKWVEELLRAIDYQRSCFEEAQKKCVALEKKLSHLEGQINNAQLQIEPLFDAGLKIFNFLNPSDLEEVRHYRDPPDGVVKVMDAICLLFNRPPGWESAKQLLGQYNFFQELEFFDRYSLTNEQLQQLGQIVHSPQFVPESVLEVSKACESLCRWVQAVYRCCRMRHQLSVKKQLEVLDKEAQGQLQLAKQQMEEEYHRLEDLKLQLQIQIQKELEEELLELQTAESSEREAAAAVEQLETLDRDWRAAAQEAELNNQTLPGDALILAATISYLGPFGSDIRTELLSKWRELCLTGSININPEDPRTSMFTHSDAAPSRPPLGFPIPVSERLQLTLGRALGLLRDAPPARMVVKLLLWGCRRAWVQRWPLLTDTQQHLDISSQSCLITGEKAKLEEETECEMVVCADDPELLDKLDQAAEKGLRVLVTHVERAIPSPRFLARLVRSAGCLHPGLKQRVQPTHPEFCLFLSTHLPVQLLNSEIHPSILAEVRVVDLSLSSGEIQELMLTQLLQSQCKKLLIQHLQFQNDKQSLQERLVSEEDALMDYILQSNTPLLEDSAFLPRVAVCQDAMKELQAEIQQLSEELEYLESLLAASRHLMRLAAALHQALQEVSRLSPAYFFSLRGFIAVMQEAFIVKDRPLVSCTAGKVPEGIIPEVMNRMVAQLLGQYRPCLFKSHVAVLELLLSVALLQHNQPCSEAERVAFLRGLQDIQHPVTRVCSLPPAVSHSTSSLPSWIPPHIHQELFCLEKIPVFRGLIASLSTCPIQWQEYLHFPSSTVAGAVPCRSHSHLSLLQRALLWKTMLPNCLEVLAEAMAAYHLCLPGQTAGTEALHARNREAVSRYLVKHEGPIVLTVPSQRGDKWTSIQPLHLINRLAYCVAKTKKVQVKVIPFGALCDRELILSMLDKAVNEGQWLVFNNCHLLEQWDGKVVAHLSQLCSSLREERRLIHPCFRLWIISQEHSSHFIPVAVRICALPLVCDSPWGLKEELSWSLRQLVSVVQSQSLSADNMELLLRCAVFHSVLLQRQTYKHSGQGRIYSWSQEDLLVLVDALICIASRCHDTAKALQYIAVHLVHGGHLLDSADLEVVDGVAKTCLSRASPLWAGGPHILSDNTSSPGHCDLSELLQTLEQDLHNSTNIDPRVLGFSADVAAEIIQINSHNLNTLLQASQTPLGTVRSLLNQHATLPAYSHARDRLQALKRSLCTVTDAGAVSDSRLRDFLQAEWDDLIDLVSSLLSQLQQPVQYNALTFASLLELTDLSRLERRAELLSAYLRHHDTSDPPGAYRLSAFRNARGFLVAVMREAAQVNRKYISDIALHFQVLSDSTYPTSLPLGAVYLCGLQLRGASWDTQLGALQDTTVSLQPCSLPLVCVKAQVRSTDTSPCKSSLLNGVQVTHASPSTAQQLPLYHCPLYLDGERESGNDLADVNIITTFPLHAKLDPVLCSLRRVRLVSML